MGPPAPPATAQDDDEDDYKPATFQRKARREVNKNKRTGKPSHWLWRLGRGDNRKSWYGGSYDTLDDERRAQYEQNRKH